VLNVAQMSNAVSVSLVQRIFDEITVANPFNVIRTTIRLLMNTHHCMPKIQITAVFLSELVANGSTNSLWNN
jgi:hypothetical protein